MLSYLELKGIRKAYGSVVALKNAELTMERGEVRALLGGNGSGKSTLSKIIGGSVRPDSGEITLDGRRLNIYSPIDAIDKKIAVTSQELSLFPNLTVAQNLSLLKTPKKLCIFQDMKQSRSRALKALERVGLEELADTPLKALPDSRKYLVELAKALLFEPEILIIDEITSALRREEVQLVKEIIRELKDKGCIIVFISHRINEIMEICSTITVLRNGEVINTYRVNEVEEQTLLDDMIGRNVSSQKVEKDSGGGTISDARPVVKIENLSLPGFGGGPVSFELKPGQVMGVAGLQGQGQSQLLRSIFGLSGAIEYELRGRRIKISSPAGAIKKGVALVTGDRVNDGTFLGRTIEENLVVVNNLILKRRPLKSDETLKSCKVKYGKANHPIESLSGGNQQKVVLARWTSTSPVLLLADDPTKGIDVVARMEVHNIMNQLANNGTAVIFVSSDDEELVTLASRVNDYSVAVMYNGQFVKELAGEEINTTNIISASMPKKSNGDGQNEKA